LPAQKGNNQKAPQPQQKEKTKKAKPEPIKNSFLVEMQDGAVKQLSFITTSPLAVYGSTIPRIVRVIYRLKPEKERRDGKKAYGLFRQELQSLELNQEEKPEGIGVQLVAGVKNFSLEFEVRVVEEPEKEKEEKNKKGAAPEPKEKKEPKISYETVTVWGEEQIKKYKKQMPDFVITKISFWDRQKNKSRSFRFRVAVVADQTPPSPPKEAKPTKKDGKQQGKKGQEKVPPGKSGVKGGVQKGGAQAQAPKVSLQDNLAMFATKLVMQQKDGGTSLVPPQEVGA